MRRVPRSGRCGGAHSLTRALLFCWCMCHSNRPVSTWFVLRSDRRDETAVRSCSELRRHHHRSRERRRGRRRRRRRHHCQGAADPQLHGPPPPSPGTSSQHISLGVFARTGVLSWSSGGSAGHHSGPCAVSRMRVATPTTPPQVEEVMKGEDVLFCFCFVGRAVQCAFGFCLDAVCVLFGDKHDENPESMKSNGEPPLHCRCAKGKLLPLSMRPLCAVCCANGVRSEGVWASDCLRLNSPAPKVDQSSIFSSTARAAGRSVAQPGRDIPTQGKGCVCGGVIATTRQSGWGPAVSVAAGHWQVKMMMPPPPVFAVLCQQLLAQEKAGFIPPVNLEACMTQV